jgi:hypothetical protein
MAKAKYHKAQRVFVKPVGTWAYIEAVVPKWVKGCEEPIKIAYDVGMGREFTPEELEPESSGLQNGSVEESFTSEWRIMRGQNRWKSAEQCGHHPHPGTHPMVVTSDHDWGGWRVPGSEYDLDPYRIEQQAQVIVRAPVFLKLLEQFVQHAEHEPENLSDDLTKLAQVARRILGELAE